MSFFKDNSISKMIFKVLSWVILGIVFLVAAFLMYYVISSKFAEAKGAKFEPKFSLYTIISTSMEPNIKVYDVVFDCKVDPSTIKEGDVITFISSSTLSEGMTVTHRVIGIVETESGLKFRVQGDNNSTPDSSLVDYRNILGKVVFKIPQLGRLQFLIQTRGGWLFVLLIPALFVVIYDIIKVVRLSDVKDKVEEALKEPEEDLELKRKEEQLKLRLKKKIVGVVPVEPVIQTVKENSDNKEENNDLPIIKENKTTKTKPKKKGKVVKKEEISIAEKTIYDNEIKNIRNKKTDKDNSDSDALLDEILANSKRRKSAKKTIKIKSKKKEPANINEKLNDYDINIEMNEIFNNIKKLNEIDDDMPKEK